MQKITGYLPANDGAKAAFKDADIIVIPAGIPRMFPLSAHICVCAESIFVSNC